MPQHAARLALALATLLPVAAAANAAAANIIVSSSAFTHQGAIPAAYTCVGGGAPPPLSWSDVPSGTRSIAVLVLDPDAPGGTFEHLAAFNLPPTRRSLPTDALQSIGPGSGLRTARNSAGQPGFAPICPPSGAHHYHFVVLALDEILDVPPGASGADVQRAAVAHTLARGELVGVASAR